MNCLALSLLHHLAIKQFLTVLYVHNSEVSLKHVQASLVVGGGGGGVGVG